MMSTSVFVCLLTRISPKSHVRSLPIFLCILCMLPMAVARSSSGRVTKSQGEGVGLGVFFPTNNALYSRVFGTHTKTAEPIEMPFEMTTLVRRRYHVLDGGPDPPRHRGHIFFGGGRSGGL